MPSPKMRQPAALLRKAIGAWFSAESCSNLLAQTPWQHAEEAVTTETIW